MLDAMIAVLIFFFPGGFNIQTLGGLGLIMGRWVLVTRRIWACEVGR